MRETASQRKWFSPPELAEELGCDPLKILRWIKSGALAAIDISQNVGGKKPRWRVSAESWQTFLASRSSAPQPKPVRRRKQADGFIRFF